MNRSLVAAFVGIALLNTACSPSPESAAPASNSSLDASSSAMAATSVNSEQTSSAVNTPVARELIGTHWKLILVQDTEVVETQTQRAPYLILDADSRVAGSDGCNKLMGSYKLTGDSLNFGELASTRMACAEEMNLAGAFSQALQNTRKYSVHADQLVLQDESGLQLARFQAVAAQ